MLRILFLLFFSSSQLNADVGRFDIIEIRYSNQIYFTKIWSNGILKDNDLRYYSWDNIYINDVGYYFAEHLVETDTIDLYKSLVKFDLFKIEKQYELDSILYLFKDLERVSVSDLISDYDIVNAYSGNTFGFTSTNNISNDDNLWISESNVEVLFDFEDYELCSMKLYGIKDELSECRIEELRVEIDSLLKNFMYKEFHKLLNEVLKEKIVMIGTCSC